MGISIHFVCPLLLCENRVWSTYLWKHPIGKTDGFLYIFPTHPTALKCFGWSIHFGRWNCDVFTNYPILPRSERSSPYCQALAEERHQRALECGVEFWQHLIWFTVEISYIYVHIYIHTYMEVSWNRDVTSKVFGVHFWNMWKLIIGWNRTQVPWMFQLGYP